uniref:Uncharacterized protein n=1 Tax=Tetranychus urticae TaxID=32264 RepID=T1KXF4_TETUR
MELNSSSDHKLIRITINNDKLLAYASDKTTRLDMSRYIAMNGFWFVSVPEKTDTASEGSNPKRHNARHRKDGQIDVPGVPGVASGLRMPDSANWPKH